MIKKIKYKLKKYKIINPLLFLKRYLKYKFYKLWYMNKGEYIIFQSNNGEKPSNNLYNLFLELYNDERYKKYKFIWIYNDKRYYNFLSSIEDIVFFKMYTKWYYRGISRAKFLITDKNIDSWIRPKRNQIFLQIPDDDIINFKKVSNKIFNIDIKNIDYYISFSAELSKKIKISSNFKKYNCKFLDCKYFDSIIITKEEKDNKIQEIKNKLNIPLDKKVILYTPPKVHSNDKILFERVIKLEELKAKFDNEYIIIIKKPINTILNYDKEYFGEFVYISSDYTNNSDLYLISDYLISDNYNDIIQFSKSKKPFTIYTFDKLTYCKQTGLKIDELLTQIADINDDLVNIVNKNIENFSFNKKYLDFIKDANDSEKHLSIKETFKKCILDREEVKEPFTFEKLGHDLHLFEILNSILGFFKNIGFCFNINNRLIYSFKNKYYGQRCFLIGNGPSLTVNDLNLLKNEITFGCNMIFKIYDITTWRTTYHFVADGLYSAKMKSEFNQGITSPCFAIDSVAKNLSGLKNLTLIKAGSLRKVYKFKANPLAFHSPGGTVMSLMLQIAIYMGFKEIYLLGVDCTSSVAADGHFLKAYDNKDVIQSDIARVRRRLKKPDMTAEDVAQYYFDRVYQTYSIIKKYADRKSIKIYNATRGGKLEVFPRVELEKILKGVKNENSSNSTN